MVFLVPFLVAMPADLFSIMQGRCLTSGFVFLRQFFKLNFLNQIFKPNFLNPFLLKNAKILIQENLCKKFQKMLMQENLCKKCKKI